MFYGLVLFMMYTAWPVTLAGWAIMISFAPILVFIGLRLFPTENLTLLQTLYFLIMLGLIAAMFKFDAYCGNCISRHFRDVI